MKEIIEQSQFLIYQSDNGQIKLDVALEDETVWLTQDQMATLFGKGGSSIGPNSQKLSRDEIIEMVERSGAIYFDEKIHKSATFDNDFDVVAYKNFLQKARISDTIAPQQVLKNLHCLIDDGRFTNLGVLFFAKTLDFKLRQAICTCVLFKGIDKLHIIDRKDFDTNMLDNIDNAVNFVKRNTNVEYV